ncbi:HupE/UreJ family protein [Zavarzinia sp. CC-PAN008]|uniref:HupE/UreJ family protein n=1 Tax=Zavarzinia sp. CC-PAN008 TaxID=3243332 RepID=UPI003F749B16
MIRFKHLALPLAFCLVAGPAFAHTGAGATHGFTHGFLHPILGLDHLLAMIAVGLWAGLAGGRALWLWPTAFVGSMLAGGAIGMTGAEVPFVELAIVLSLVAFGAAIAMDYKPAPALAAAVIAVFGIAHGFAHGAEAPADASGLTYAAGFVAGTALLHVVGLAIAVACSRTIGRLAGRALGAGVGIAGLALLAGA